MVNLEAWEILIFILNSMLIILFFLFELSGLSMEEDTINLDVSVSFIEGFISKGIYKLEGELLRGDKKIGKVCRFSRIYFPCNKKECNYTFKIEIDTKELEEKDVIDFLEKKDFKLNMKFVEINKKEEFIKEEPFDYILKENFKENIYLDLIKIENIKLNLKEKPSVNFDLKLINPFKFKVFVQDLNISFQIEEQKIEKNFKLNEKLQKGEKNFNLEIPIKKDLLIYILSKKFFEEDLSAKISANYNGSLNFFIGEHSLKIDF